MAAAAENKGFLDWRSRPRQGRIPGICRAARSLGISRQSLWLCLTGQTANPDLLRRYQALLSDRSTPTVSHESLD
jgi:hypothetical protein